MYIANDSHGFESQFDLFIHFKRTLTCNVRMDRLTPAKAHNKLTRYSSSQHASSLRELTSHVGSNHLPSNKGDITISHLYLSNLKLVLDLATPEWRKAGLI